GPVRTAPHGDGPPTLPSLYGAPALDDADQYHDDRDDQQDVQQPAQRVPGNQSEQPQHEQNNDNRPQHVASQGKEGTCRGIEATSVPEQGKNSAVNRGAVRV